MIEFNDDNYLDILNKHFDNNDTVVCLISPRKSCSNCVSTIANIEKFNSKNPDKIFFYYIDYTKYDMLQSYYELTRLLEYPHSIVFYGNWEDKEFLEGVITVRQLESILNKA